MIEDLLAHPVRDLFRYLQQNNLQDVGQHTGYNIEKNHQDAVIANLVEIDLSRSADRIDRDAGQLRAVQGKHVGDDRRHACQQ